MLYLGFTGASLGWLRTLPEANDDGMKVVALFLVTIWLGDSGAYYVCKNFGSHPMAPAI